MRYFISFTDPNLREDEQFLGAVIVRGKDEKEALRNCYYLDLLPSAPHACTSEIPDDVYLPEEYCNRIMSYEEALSLNTYLPVISDFGN